MKIKSLLLGSLAIAGMSGLATGANAADLAKGVMTSLDVCDALGLSGLTISSDTDCLQISGGVSYSFTWGDYKAGPGTAGNGLGLVQTGDDISRIPQPGNSTAIGSGLGNNGTATDWDSQMSAWLQVVGTADSDFGPAKAVIHMTSSQYRHSANGYGWFDGGDTGGVTTNVGLGEYNSAGSLHATGDGPSGTVLFDQAYVSVGDSTVLTAGKTGSIADLDDDTPLSYLGLFNSDNVGTGVLWSVKGWAGGSDYINPNGGLSDANSGADVHLGGESIQLSSSLGNGVTVKGALEDINDTNSARAGTAVGVLSYAGDNLTAHVTLIEAGILDGHPDVFAYHAGLAGTFDKFSIVAAAAGDQSGYFDGLLSAQVGLDMFKLAASGEFLHYANTGTSGVANGNLIAGPGGLTGGNSTIAYAGDATANGTTAAGKNGFGAGLSATMAISDGVTLNLGGRYFDTDTSTTGNEAYQIAASLVAAVTETISLSGEIGVYGTDSQIGTSTNTNFGPTVPGVSKPGYALGTSVVAPGTWETVEYGAASVAWAPGGGFTSSLKAAAYSNGAYQGTFTAAKNFQ